MNTFWRKLKGLLAVPDTFDPDELRRRRALNFILIFLLFATVVFAAWLLRDESLASLMNPDLRTVIFAFASAIAFWVVLLGLNRWKRTPKDLVGWIFILGMIALVAVADDPVQLTSGRSIFTWAIPVTLSVVVLPTTTVFVVDLLIALVFMSYAKFDYEHFQIYTVFEIYVVSFISWLGMSIAERAIRDARSESRKNAAILEGVAEGVIVLEQNDQIVLANRAASELIGDETANILPTTESAEIGGRILSFHWSEVEGVGWVAVVRDISRQIEIDRAKDAVLGVVSHEMRTPLAAIVGFCEFLKIHPTPETADRIRINALRMIGMVDHLLDLAQLQANALKLYPEKFSPRLLADEVNNLLRAQAAENQIGFTIAVAESLPDELIGDFHRYQQILASLADNAIRFTKEGGCVDVRLAPGPQADKWQMIVSDTGIGIPPERLPDIFLPFRRASDYTRRSYQGVGLGLSIAKRIAQLAHGDIEVKSRVGHGSTFIVTLPINGGAR